MWEWLESFCALCLIAVAILGTAWFISMFRDAVPGGSKRRHFTTQKPDSASHDPARLCRKCGGWGRVTENDMFGLGFHFTRCDKCDGSGRESDRS